MIGYCIVPRKSCQLPLESMKDLSNSLTDHQGLLTSKNPLEFLVVATIQLKEKSCFGVASTSLKGLSFHLRLSLTGPDLGLEVSCPQELLEDSQEVYSKLEPVCLRLGKVIGHKQPLVDRLVRAYNRAGRLRPCHLFPDDLSLISFDHVGRAQAFTYCMEDGGDGPTGQQRIHLFKLSESLEMGEEILRSLLIPKPESGPEDWGTSRSVLGAIREQSLLENVKGAFSPFPYASSQNLGRRDLVEGQLGPNLGKIDPLFASSPADHASPASPPSPIPDAQEPSAIIVEALKNRVANLELANQELLSKNLQQVIRQHENAGPSGVPKELFRASYLNSFVQFSKLSILAPEMQQGELVKLSSQLSQFKALHLPPALTRVVFQELTQWLMIAGVQHPAVLATVGAVAQRQHIQCLQSLLHEISQASDEILAPVRVHLRAINKREHILKGLGARFQFASMSFQDVIFNRRNICGLCLLVVPAARLATHFDGHARCLSCSPAHVTLLSNVVSMGLFMQLGTADVVSSVEKFSLEQMLEFTPSCAASDLPFEQEIHVKAFMLHLSCLPLPLFSDLLNFTLASFQAASISAPQGLADLCAKRFDLFKAHLGLQSLAQCIVMPWGLEDLSLFDVLKVGLIFNFLI